MQLQQLLEEGGVVIAYRSYTHGDARSWLPLSMACNGLRCQAPFQTCFGIGATILGDARPWLPVHGLQWPMESLVGALCQ